MNLADKIIFLRNSLIKHFIITLILLASTFAVIYQLTNNLKNLKKDYKDALYNIKLSQKKLTILDVANNLPEDKFISYKAITPCEISLLVKKISTELIANKKIYTPTISTVLQEKRFEGTAQVNIYYLIINFDTTKIQDSIETTNYIRSQLPLNSELYILKLNHNDMFQQNYKSKNFIKTRLHFIIKKVAQDS
ncbi:MAG: hypothetical protein K9G11_03020 [Rickettsiaceae bacterium]|nr:hypothetical protein [Rickettsiaceae bacterium]